MEELFQACRTGNVDRFKQLFSELSNLKNIFDKQDHAGRKLIHVAAEGGSVEIINIILEKDGAQQSALDNENDTPLNVALMSEHIPAASLLLEKLLELGATPRKSRHGNHPLHYACKTGNLELIQTLSNAFPTSVYATNSRGHTPLSHAVWMGNVGAVRILFGQNTSSPVSKFNDLSTLLPNFTVGEQQLEQPINIFVLGDTQCGKSSLIKSIQAESHSEKFWGLTYNTTAVDMHQIGLVPTHFMSKKYGRVIFHDLASGTKYLNMQLVHTPEEVERSLFFVVVDCRLERKEMDRKLEFWLSVVYQQSQQATKGLHGLRSPVLPNVVIVGSFYDYLKAFRLANDIRLDQTFRTVTRNNPDLVSRCNILQRACVDCRKAKSFFTSRIRTALKDHCRQRQIDAPPLDYRFYVLSSIFVEKIKEKQQPPVISLTQLFREIQDKSSQSETVSIYSLLATESIIELLGLCKVLEEPKVILLIGSDSYTPEEDAMIVYDMHSLANSVDAALREWKASLDHSNDNKVALNQLCDYLSERLGIRPDAVVSILDVLKIHTLPVEGDGGETVPLNNRYYFIPSLLPKVDSNVEDWGENQFCFAWTFRPCATQLCRHFLPSFTNSLLITLFDICAGREVMDCSLWQGGASFRQEDDVEMIVLVSSNAVTLNMRYREKFEIICLNLRNIFLAAIRRLKNMHQPETEAEELITPRDAPHFPIRTPSPQNVIKLVELKKKFSTSSLNLLQSTTNSQLSMPHSHSTQTSNEEHPNPFFEPCYFIVLLETANQQFLLYRDHRTSEMSDTFLYDLRRCFGYARYQILDEYFGFPPITITPSSSVCSGSVPSLPQQQQRRHESLAVKCKTYGQLLSCLDSISIFKTEAFLAESQNAMILSHRDSIISGSAEKSSLSDHTPTLQPEPQTRRLFPFTTRTTDNYSNVYFVDQLQVFTCGYEGGVFHSAQDGVTIKFPCGAVPESSPPITIEFGVALNGPFEFPTEHTNPVSPFVWLCTDRPGFVFRKPVEIIIPHFLLLDKAQSKNLTFLKANHREGEDEYEFVECADKKRFKARSSYGILYTTHTCFLCIAYNDIMSELSTAKITYCLVKVIPKNPGVTFNIVVCIAYFLEACMETIQRQFSPEEFDISRTLISLSPGLPEPQVSLHFPNQLEGGWIATMEGGENEISASDIQFWNRDIRELQLMDRYRMYPPRFSIYVCGTEATKNSVLHLPFEGLTKPRKYEIPLQIPFPRSTESLASNSAPMASPGMPFPPRSRTESLASNSAPMDSPAIGHVFAHPLNQLMEKLVQFMDVDLVRRNLIQNSAISQEDSEKLLNASLERHSQSIKVELLVNVIKKNGREGLQGFVAALRETTDGTGHKTLVDLLIPLIEH